MDGDAPTPTDARIPPADLDAEAAVLSACFLADATPEIEPGETNG